MLLVFPIFAILLPAAIIMVLGNPRYLSKIPQPQKRNEQEPTISIIIPARNEEFNIPQLLESFRSEKQHIHEIIVVDDESTDNTATLAEERSEPLRFNDTMSKEEHKLHQAKWKARKRQSQLKMGLVLLSMATLVLMWVVWLAN